jgi:transposase
MKYPGIDLHSNNSVIVVSDAADRILCKRRVPNELKTVIALLEPHRAELAGVVVQATYNGYGLVAGLQAAGYRVYLANTSAIKPYEGRKHSNDDSDATHLAHLLRLAIVATGYICPREERALRDLARQAPAVEPQPHGAHSAGGEHRGAANRRTHERLCG